MESVCIVEDGNILEIKWTNGHPSRYHAKWLRYNCKCETCVRDFFELSTLDIMVAPEELSLESAEIKGKYLTTTYKGEDSCKHETRHEMEWLRKYCYCDTCLNDDITSRDVITANNRKKMDELPSVNWEKMSENKNETLFQIMKNVIEKGVCLIRNVPAVYGEIFEFAAHFCPRENTLFGDLFDVTNENLEDQRYTWTRLPPHQDLPQYESMPGVELLHAIRFDSVIDGGESQIMDLFRTAELFRKESPEHFQALAEIPCNFDRVDYVEGPRMMYLEHQKTHFVVDYFGKLVAVNWHTGIAATPRIKSQDVDRYYNACRAFLKLINKNEGAIHYRYDIGDLVMFNNRRMAHSRNGFKMNGGVRHLQGLYLKIDHLKSKYMTLAHKLGHKVVPPKVGNGSSF